MSRYLISHFSLSLTAKSVLPDQTEIMRCKSVCIKYSDCMCFCLNADTQLSCLLCRFVLDQVCPFYSLWQHSSRGTVYCCPRRHVKYAVVFLFPCQRRVRAAKRFHPFSGKLLTKLNSIPFSQVTVS